MFSIEIGFVSVDIWDFLDILLVGILIFQVYKQLYGTLAFNILIGLILVWLISTTVKSLEMNMLANILGGFVEAGIIILVIVFQQEIRRFLSQLGRGSGIGKSNFFERFIRRNARHIDETSKDKIREELIKSINNMSGEKTGALIVFTNSTDKLFFHDTGVPINGEISSKLIESIFDKNTPLHDGALVIAQNRILAANCVLPVSENTNLPTRVGMRHRAAVGITEKIDAHVIIVSEETGKISYAHKGKITVNITQNKLNEALNKALDD